jgi:hypothetical protein
MDEVIEFLKQRYPQSNAPDAKIVIEHYLSALASQAAFARRHLFVNCWHLGELESEAMWRIYCREGIGVAVVLPYANLRDSLPNVDTYIGKVSYIQYDVEHITTIFDLAHGFSFAMHKRKEFSHESEARIVVERPDPTPDSIKIPWAPEDHIAKLVISPYSSPWYADTVVDVVKRISPRLADRVCQSSM